MAWRLVLLVLSFLCAFPAIVFSHPGGLDANGCHHDRKHGGYHCHKGEFAGRAFASEKEMLTSRQASYTAVPPILSSQKFSGPVVRIKDGDTIFVLHDGRAEEIRLNGIDCPEKDQPYGAEATKYISRLVLGKEVTVTGYELDRFGRTVGDIALANGTDVNRELVRAGLAWWFRKYSQDKNLEQLETRAREGKQGLWNSAHPIPPWEWRRMVRERAG